MIVCKVVTEVSPEKVTLTRTPAGFHYAASRMVSEKASDGSPMPREFTGYETDFNSAYVEAQPDFSDYSMFVRGFRLPELVINMGLGQDRLANLFKMTQPNRLTIDDFLHQRGWYLMAAILVPFADSPTEDWVLALPAKTGTVAYDGPMQVATDWAQCVDNYMPRIRSQGSLVRYGDNVLIRFSALNPALQPVANNPWLFFEATAGVLRTSRARSGDNCVVDISGLPTGTEVRIKAGFKYMPGIFDYTFTV